MRISILISDPWDLGESVGWKPLLGEIVRRQIDDLSGDRALIKFDNNVQYHGSTWRFAVAAPRHEGDRFATLEDGGKVFASFMGVSEQQAESTTPLDTSMWRGEFAFIGEIEMIS